MEQAMNEEIPSYVYSHIDPDECRVLNIVEVHPLIKFSLETFSIYEAPGYEALSYAWDTSSEMEDSLCNGARFRISRTLGQALRGIHAHSGGGWIWVDAICINHTDAEEKAHHVAGMGELYSCADQVLVWLGDAADYSDLACALLPELTAKIWSLKDSEGGWRPLSTDDIVAHRAWFQRLWVVQEVVLAHACVFLCGLQQVEWHILVDFAIATSKSFFVSNMAGLHVKAMGEDRVSRSTNGFRLIRNSRRLKDSLEDDEKEVTGLQATIDIMQIYAVRDMLPDALRVQMAVDYSEEIKQNYGIVHARFFRQCLERLSDWPSLCFPPNAGHEDIPSYYLPIIGCQARTPATINDGKGALCIAGISADTVREIVPLSPVVDGSINVLLAHRILRATTDCSAHIPDGAGNHERLLGVLIGQCGWLKPPQFSGRPYGDVLDGSHEGDANPVPVNINTAEYIFDQYRFWRGYLDLIMIRWPGRRFALTTNGRMAIVPCHTTRGDTVCSFLGGTLPQVLSRHEDGVYWKYVGPSVVEGIMEGEVFNTREQ
ncbi:hypothetical protein BDV24DRAFT_172978 [Aspergillus arachidicola]|uniref:Heterokaryon incompatibility domain-containing protein n=1 Tax=Aspergillus arachidicola TaxID=656916 RepID=A0A5N6YCK9_9EURO|nr:hypothetical protein BDV24DRAFT_172978 [Aspergillus arachidicola]